jgi:hypothetical protein
VKFGISDFGYSLDLNDMQLEEKIEKIINAGMADLRFSVNLCSLPSKYKIGDVFRLFKGIERLKRFSLNYHFYLFLSDELAAAHACKVPKEWEHMSEFDLLETVASDVNIFCSMLNSSGINVRSITIGNESEWGLLDFRPNRKIDAKDFKSNTDFEWLEKNIWSMNIKIINKISSVIRLRLPDTLIVVHSDSIGRKDFTSRYFKYLEKNNADFDIIGLTYNPWSIWDCDLDGFSKIKEVLSNLNRNKSIWFVEYAYISGIIPNETTDCKPIIPFSYHGVVLFHELFLEFCSANKIDMVFFWRGDHDCAYPVYETSQAGLFYNGSLIDNIKNLLVSQQ